MSFHDYYGYPGYYDDSYYGYDPYNTWDPYASYNPYADPYADFDWQGTDWSSPDVMAQYGLTPRDYTMPFDYSGFSTWEPGMGGASPISDDMVVALYQAGNKDWSGFDLTYEQQSALSAAGEDWTTGGADQASTQSWLQSLAGGTGTLAQLARIAQSLGTGIGAAYQAIGGAPGLAVLAGGGAALGAALMPSAEPLRAPDFSAPAVLNPEQRQLLSYIQSQAGREENLQNLQAPAYAAVLGGAQDMLGGLAPQAAAEQQARNAALGNIQANLASPLTPNELPAQYAPFMANATAAERLIAETLAGGAGPTLEAQRLADERRLAFENQQREALGPGYVTSYPYNEAKAKEEQLIREGLERSGLGAQAARLGMLSGVALPRAQFAEQATTGSFGRGLAGRQQQLATYQGLNTTADTLGRLAATIGASAPTGTATAGLSALSGLQDRQQSLLNSIYQFNANLQNQRNQNLWQFAGSALGGGLYGLTRRT